MKRDNDIIKALGFVTLYAAYVEEAVDVVMERLSLFKAISDKDRRKQTSAKIKWCIKVINQIDNGELTNLVELLEETADLLEQRNIVVHGRHYSHTDRSALLKSSRNNVPDKIATTDEHYDLAEKLLNMQAVLPNKKSFATIRAIVEAHGA